MKVADALSAHARAYGRLEAALNRPYSGHHWGIYRKAAALLQGVSNNNPFVDGNKRSAIALMLLLLNRSDYSLRFPAKMDRDQAIEWLAVSVAMGLLNFDELAHWLKEKIVKV